MTTPSTKRRHDWRDGIEQPCDNAGCNWQRTKRSEIDPANPGGYVYRYAKGFWHTRERVPRCGSKE